MKVVMKKGGALVLACMLTVLTLTGCASRQTSSAQEPQPQNEQQRIVATTVAITQIADALEMDLIGIPASSRNLPKRYEGVAQVGSPMTPNMEIIKSLAPTEVMSVTTLQYDLEPAFRNAGLTASFLDLTSLEKMSEAILTLGDKYGRQKQANAIVGAYKEKLADINKRLQGKESPTVLILLGVPGSYLVATEQSYIGNLVKLAGGKNIGTDSSVEYLASNTEYLQQANPQIILRAAHGMPDEVVKMFDKEFQKNDIWKHFDAVKNNRVYDLDDELFGTTGNLAAVQALDALMGMLYP